MEKKNNFIFYLHNINYNKINETYNLPILSNIETNNLDTIPVEEITNISNLTINEPNNFTYLDDAKKEKKCLITMRDYISGKSFETNKVDRCCFWCRSEFITKPIGCPLEFIPSKLIKKYYSEITKDEYTIRENISKEKREEYENKKLINKDFNLKIEKNEYYSSDGFFCSFNCCLAFILDNKHNPLYENSEYLLSQIYLSLFENGNIVPAPNWRLLQKYGGSLTIEEFRRDFNKYEYQDTDNHITFKSIGFLYEQNLKF